MACRPLRAAIYTHPLRAALAALLLLPLAGCGDAGECSLTVSYAKHPAAEGDRARLFTYAADGRLRQVDSALVEAGEATLACTGAPTRVMVATASGRAATFVSEPRHLTWIVGESSVLGGPLNAAKEAYEQAAATARARAAARYDSVAAAHADDRDEQRRELALLVEGEKRRATEQAMRVVRDNADNAVAQYVFWRGVAENPALDAAEVLTLLREAGPGVAAFPPVALAEQRCRRLESTAAGQRYANVALDNDSLSSLLGAASVTLLHVFDPYDETTPRSFALLRDLARRWPARLCITSVAEWADTTLASRVAGKLRASWPVASDRQGRVADAYAIRDLPYYIVIAPSGLIEERGINEGALAHWLSAEMEGRP